MPSNNEIKIQITPEVKQIPTTLRNRASSIERDGGFNDANGRRRKQTFEGLVTTLEELQKQGQLTTKQLQEYDRVQEQAFDLLKKEASYTKNLTDEMRKLLDVEEKARQRVKEQQRARSELLSKGKSNEAGTAFTSLKGFKGRLTALGIRKVNKDGTFSKQTVNDFETISSNIAQGKARYVDANGRDLTSNVEWQTMETELKSANGELLACNTNLSKFENALDDARIAVEKQIKTEQASGIGGLSQPKEVAVESAQADTAIQGLLNKGAQKEGAVAADSIDITTKALNKQSSSLGKALKQFSIYAIAVRAARKALTDAVKTVRDLDKYLTEQAMVTGKTRAQTYKLLKDYQNLASTLGATTKEIAEVATQFMRQGKTAEESLTLTTAAISAAKVAGISATESVDYLTTALNGFRLSAEDAMTISDKFAAVAAQSATSYDEIATALSKVASQANLAGMSIDYTTALLAKGIETTREAPETIGTALKTVIARMREMGDYGETLEGDTDVNNVETQLAYIDIKLRTMNGELRSTEDVLNELGKKWDTLNSNQQAAVAKALAGTRQQSRLIAMMSDYERTIELQQIAERSSGATMAQMATYMEGMEAALNKVAVAWEEIVTAVADSNFIIGIVEKVANLLDAVGSFLENDIGLITTTVVLSSLLLISLTKRHEMQKAQNRAILEENKEKQKQKSLDLDAKKAALEAAKTLLTNLKGEAAITKQKAKQALLDNNTLNDSIAMKAISENDLEIEEMELAIDKELALTNAEIKMTKMDMLNTDIQLAQNAVGFSEIWGNLATIMTPIISILTIINTLQQAYAASQLKSAAAAKVQTAAEGKKSAVIGQGMAAGVISAFSSAGIPGVIAGIAIAGALLAALLGTSLAIAASAGAFSGKSEAEKSSEAINKLSKDIYDLNKKATSLQTVVDKFDDLDKKVLKTNADLEEMHSLLESATDFLSEDEQAAYKTLTSDRARKEFLETVIQDANQELNDTRSKQRTDILNLRKKGGATWNDWLTSSDTEVMQARDAMYALNNAYLYNAIDNAALTDSTAIESIIQNILDNVSVSKAADILANQDIIDEYIHTLGEFGEAASILNSEDYTITERVEAYKELEQAIEHIGDPEVLKTFQEINHEWGDFAQLTATTQKYIDYIGADIVGIDILATAIQDLGYSSAESLEYIDKLFTILEQGGDLRTTLDSLFGENAQTILNSYDKAFGTTILNMGQNIDKFRNQIQNIYEVSKKWNEMSETDRTSFISENSALFEGANGARLLEAFATGNYNLIQEALSTSEVLTKQLNQDLKNVQLQIQIEEAKAEEDRNEAWLSYLKEQEKMLQNSNEIFAASLEWKLEQQQAELDAYKDTLKQEQDALVESLEKRKDAYSKYFEDVNQNAEDEDYEEQSNQLIENITKLGSTLNGNAAVTRADLENQLKELEKERLDTLRQRAQEQIQENLEKEVDEINQKFDQLLENNRALLAAMTGQLSNNPEAFLASSVANQITSGASTDLDIQSYVQTLRSTYGSALPGFNWDNFVTKNEAGQLILNIAGKEIVLSDGDQQTVYNAIQAALSAVGYKI